MVFWVIRRGACFRLDTDGDKADTGGEASVQAGLIYRGTGLETVSWVIRRGTDGDKASTGGESSVQAGLICRGTGWETVSWVIRRGTDGDKAGGEASGKCWKVNLLGRRTGCGSFRDAGFCRNVYGDKAGTTGGEASGISWKGNLHDELVAGVLEARVLVGTQVLTRSEWEVKHPV